MKNDESREEGGGRRRGRGREKLVVIRVRRAIGGDSEMGIKVDES